MHRQKKKTRPQSTYHLLHFLLRFQPSLAGRVQRKECVSQSRVRTVTDATILDGTVQNYTIYRFDFDLSHF
ncbi:hypothetical protein DAI22_12g138900 [Oryza sativa Japonica Group]|nr:hypothetical protein DAI22_12g138900 [Oryza sativa Japonica Group]